MGLKRVAVFDSIPPNVTNTGIVFYMLTPLSSYTPTGPRRGYALSGTPVTTDINEAWVVRGDDYGLYVYKIEVTNMSNMDVGSKFSVTRTDHYCEMVPWKK